MPQCGGHGPPSRMKCGVRGGCQSWVSTTSVPLLRARVASPLITGDDVGRAASASDPEKMRLDIDDDEGDTGAVAEHGPTLARPAVASESG